MCVTSTSKMLHSSTFSESGEVLMLVFPLPLLVSQCFSGAVHQQAHHALTRRLPNAAMALLGGQLPRAGHRAISSPLGRWGGCWWLAGFFRFPFTRLPLGLGEDGEAEEEEEEETARQDTHGGWEETFGHRNKKVSLLPEPLVQWFVLILILAFILWRRKSC